MKIEICRDWHCITCAACWAVPTRIGSTVTKFAIHKSTTDHPRPPRPPHPHRTTHPRSLPITNQPLPPPPPCFRLQPSYPVPRFSPQPSARSLQPTPQLSGTSGPPPPPRHRPPLPPPPRSTTSHCVLAILAARDGRSSQRARRWSGQQAPVSARPSCWRGCY